MTIYVLLTDGSIADPHKPSHGGYGYELNKFEDGELVQLYHGGGTEDNTTNNRMEMSAIRDGLMLTLDHLTNFKYSSEDILIVISDSDLCVKSLTQYMKGWLRRERDGVLYKHDNRPVENQDIIKPAYKFKTLIEELIRVNIFHINSHIPKNKTSRVEYMKKFMKRNNCMMSLDLFNKIADRNDELDRLAKSFMMKKRKVESISANKN